jgi:uncharacterized membrane protein
MRTLNFLCVLVSWVGVLVGIACVGLAVASVVSHFLPGDPVCLYYAQYRGSVAEYPYAWVNWSAAFVVVAGVAMSMIVGIRKLWSR